MTVADRVDDFVRANLPWLFALVLVAAVGLRLPALGTPGLNDAEARFGFAAIEVAAGQPALSGTTDSAAYSALTALAFTLAGPSSASARVWPAVAGVILAAVPLLMLKKLGPAPTLAIGLLLALSPASAALSRTADGAMLGALGFATLAAMLYADEAAARPWLTGIVVGLMSVAGPAGLGGLLVLVATAALERVVVGRSWSQAADSHAWHQIGRSLRAPLFWAGFVAAFLSLSTALVFPNAIGALGQGLTTWGRSFLFIGTTGAVQALLLIVAYETLAVAFAIPSLRAFARSPDLGIFMPLLTATALVYFFARPGRVPGDALFVVVPILVLAVIGIRETLRLLSRETVNGVIVLEVALILGLGVFAHQSLTAYAVQPDVPTYGPLRLALGGVALLGIFLVAGLFATGWSGNVPGAVGGLGFGLAIMLLVGELSAVWGVSYSRRANSNELWWQSVSPRELEVLVDSVAEISARETGTPDELAVVVQGKRETAVGWAFKDFTYLRFVDEAARSSNPAVFIAPLVGEVGSERMPSLAANYVGQGLTVGDRRAWQQLPPEPVGWWLYRIGTDVRERVILWVREDVQFPPAQP